MTAKPSARLLLLKRLLIVCLFFLTTGSVARTQLYRVKQCPPGRRIAMLRHVIWGKDGRGAQDPLKVVDSAIAWAREQHDEALRDYAQLFYFKILSDHEATETGALSKLLDNEPTFLKQPDSEIAGVYCLFLGRAYYRFFRFEKAFHFLLKAESIFNAIGYSGLSIPSMYSFEFMEIYLYFEDYRNALNYAKLTVRYSDTLINSPVFDLNNLGVIYLRLKDYAAAGKTFLQTLALAKATGSTVYTGIASGNYGNTLRLQGQYAASLPYMYTDVALNEKAVPDNSAITCVYIANSLLHLDSTAKAKQYLDSSLHLQPNRVWGSFNTNYYETRTLYYKKIRDFETAALYQDTLLRLKDSLRALFDSKVLMTTTLKAGEEKYLANQKKAALEAKNVKLTRNFVILILLVTFAGTLIFIHQRRQKERRLLQERQRQADEDLKAANEKLEQYLQNIREKNGLIEKIEASLAPLPGDAVSESDASPGEENMARLRQSVIMTENEWAAFRQLFERVFPDFFHRVGQKYEGLTEAEQRVLALCKLNMDSRDMASMLGISIGSLRTSRYRLRKKYPLLADDEEFSGVI